MFCLNQGADNVVVLLHEIYGINRFISGIGREFYRWGFDVCCPDLTGDGAVFPYAHEEEAYANFMQAGGLGRYKEVNGRMEELRGEYRKIILIGFSAGATIAWRCTESKLCDCMVGVYGSRIRDYKEVEPVCRTLLLFAEQEKFFNAASLAKELENKRNTSIQIIKGRHGFMDPFSGNFDRDASAKATETIREFLMI